MIVDNIITINGENFAHNLRTINRVSGKFKSKVIRPTKETYPQYFIQKFWISDLFLFTRISGIQES